MATELSEHAKHRSTYKVTFSAFQDSAGNAVTPDTVTWTLRNEYNTVINSRSSVSATPSTSVDVYLQGDDLDIADGRERKVQLYATYTSGGSTYPLRDSCIFYIDGV